MRVNDDREGPLQSFAPRARAFSNHLRVRLGEGAEEGLVHATLPGSARGDQRGQLVGVPHQAEAASLQDGAQGGRESDLARLVQNADVENAALQQRMPHAQACRGHLHRTPRSACHIPA